MPPGTAAKSRHLFSLGEVAITAACIGACIALGGVLAALGSQIWPVADDFCNQVLVQERGLGGALSWLWHGWSGRLVSSALLYSTFAVIPFTYLRWVSALFGLSLVLLAWQMLAFCDIHRSRYRWPLAAWVLSGLCLGLYPLMGQTVFWLTGGIVYLLPLLLSVHWLTGIRRLVDSENAMDNRYWFAESLLLGNCIELLWPIVFAYAFWATWGVWKKSPAWKMRSLMWRCAGLSLGALILVAAPGNYNRAQAAPGSFDFRPAFLVGHYGSMLFQSANIGRSMIWVILASALSILVLHAALPRRLVPTEAILRSRRTEALVLLLGALLSLVPVLPVSAFFAPRNGLFLFVFSWLAILLLVSPLLMQMERNGASSPAYVLSLLGCGATLFGFWMLAQDAASAHGLRQALVARDRILQAAHQQQLQEVAIQPLNLPIPKTYHFDEISTDPAGWLNKCVAKHYRLDQVWLAPPP